MARQRALQSASSHAQQSDRHSDGPELLTQVEVCRRLGICDETWMRWRKSGHTPDAVMLPSGRLKWRIEDIDRLAHTPQPVQRRFFQAGVRHVRTVPARTAAEKSTTRTSTQRVS